jgi:hypothetical protein
VYRFTVLPLLRQQLWEVFLSRIQKDFWEDIEEMRLLMREEEIFYSKISLLQRKALLDRGHELLKIKEIL